MRALWYVHSEDVCAVVECVLLAVRVIEVVVLSCTKLSLKLLSNMGGDAT